MKKNQVKIWVGCGIFCIAAVLLSVWYAVTFNDSRLVAPMDFGSYSFNTKDLPMILSISLTCVYALALFIHLFISVGKSKKNVAKTNMTRKVNPKLGFLGLLGLLGLVWVVAGYN